MKKYENLFTPFNIGNATVKNRFCVAPMSIHEFDSRGQFTDSAIEYYVDRARGGFGLITTGALTSDIDVDPFSMTMKLAPLGNPRDFTCSALSMNDRIHAYGAKIFAELTMGSGRNAFGHKSCSDNPFFYNDAVRTGEYTTEEVKHKIDLMVRSAAVCKKAGFDGVEILSHWGYLMDQFTAEITNRRTDEYGGSFENRLRLHKEVIEGIRKTCGKDFPITMRFGIKSFITGLGIGKGSLDGENEAGHTLEEGIRLAKEFESYGVDALSVDVGQYESMYYAAAPMYMPKGYALEMAAEVKKAVNIPVMLVGRMNDLDMDEKAIADKKIDGVVIGRASLADPCIPTKAEMGRPDKIRPCISCNEGCINRLFTYGRVGACTVNPTAMREMNYGIEKVLQPRNIAVVGGGVAGMEAARTAKMRGHNVTLFERSNTLGGHINYAGMHKFKRDIYDLNMWFQNELKELGVDIRLNTNATADMLKELKFDAVIFATGGQVLMPKSIKGIDHEKCVSCLDAMDGKKPVGQNIVIVGGGLVGCESALAYAQEGKSVTIVEGLDKILSAGPAVPDANASMLKELLAKHNVQIITGQMLKEIDDNGAVTASRENPDEVMRINADTVILAIGFRKNPSEKNELLGSNIETFDIDHTNGIGNIQESIWRAYEVARTI